MKWLPQTDSVSFLLDVGMILLITKAAGNAIKLEIGWMCVS